MSCSRIRPIKAGSCTELCRGVRAARDAKFWGLEVISSLALDQDNRRNYSQYANCNRCSDLKTNFVIIGLVGPSEEVQ
jgi:hypothetical protein